MRTAGTTGIRCEDSVSEAKIVSLEPVDRCAEQIRRSADPNWTVKRVAVGSRREVATINVGAATGMSSILPANTHPTYFVPFPTRLDLRMIEMDCLLRRGDPTEG